jgi:hypothetical protein
MTLRTSRAHKCDETPATTVAIETRHRVVNDDNGLGESGVVSVEALQQIQEG